MQINNIQTSQKGEVVVVNRKVNFEANKVKQASLLPKTVIDKFGLDVSTRVGYKGPGEYEQAPQGLPNGLTEVFRSMKINWATHVDKNTKKSAFANANIYIG